MKKLKNKVFFVISGILSIFLISILVIFNYQDYCNEYDSIKSTLMRMENDNAKNTPNIDSNSRPSDIPDDNEVKEKETIEGNEEKKEELFMDSVVYSVTIENNEVIEVTSHSITNTTDEEITSIAEQIIASSKENMKIGNLYTEEYSYAYKNNNKTLIIVDNKQVQENLYAMLKTSLIIFICLEIIIVIVSIKVTSWIIKPVIATFEKQHQFIADASHELKTPLSVIIANAEMSEKDPKNKKWLNNIKSESERMNKLVTNLLDLAKLENGNNKELYEKVNLSKITEMAILPFESLTYEKNIKLEYNIEEDISFNCNQEQIKQLIAILIDNAIKHSISKGHIIINLSKIKNEITVSIKNKGKEISKEDQKKIFERFYRADESRNRDSNRYGLGLAIAKGIVENHNGQITVNSQNNYTTFKIIFKQN